MSNPNPYGAAGDQSTPWPQYGENAAASSSQGYSGSVPQGYPGTASQGYPGATNGGGYGGPVVVEFPKMPSRVPGVVTLIVGLILMVLVAPMVFFTTMINGLGGSAEGFAQAANLHNGSIVSVNSNGAYTVIVSGARASSCALRGDTGAVYELTQFGNDETAFTGEGIPAGQYELSCQGVPSGTQLMGFSKSVDETMMGFFMPFVWATITGVIGLIALIVGIVLIVKANGKRRRATQQAMMAAIR